MMKAIALSIVILMLLSTPVFAEQQNDEPIVDPLPGPGPPVGDVNGDGVVDILDVSLLMQHILSSETITCEDQLQRADVNNDGEINVRDVVEIIRGPILLLE